MTGQAWQATHAHTFSPMVHVQHYPNNHQYKCDPHTVDWEILALGNFHIGKFLRLKFLCVLFSPSGKVVKIFYAV